MKTSPAPSPTRRSLLTWRAAWFALLALTLWCATPRAQAQTATAPIDAALIDQVRELALIASQQSRVSGVGLSMPLRFDVSVGSLDAHLKLAPCQRVEP